MEVRLGHLAHNYQMIRRHIGQNVRMMAVVKADAYGHGAMPIAQRLEELGVDWFGVALPEEGVALRLAGITKPILCLSGFCRDQAELVIENNLTPAIFDSITLEHLDGVAGRRHRRIDYHLKVDTGMGRLGVPADMLPEFLGRARRLTHVHLDGLFSHLAWTDEEGGRALTEHQIRLFNKFGQQVHLAGFRPSLRHLANSAATISHPEAWMDMVRPGAILYGLKRDVILRSGPHLRLRPVLSLKTRIAFLKSVPAGTPLGYGAAFQTTRPSRIATLQIGYHDGYPRALSNRGFVLVRGRRAGVVGRVSMDLTLIDVTEVDGTQVGDEVTLIGQEGDQQILAEDLAERTGTISYEIVCGLGPRVPRVVVEA